MQCAKTAVAKTSLRMHGADAGARRRHRLRADDGWVEFFHERILRLELHTQLQAGIFAIFSASLALNFSGRMIARSCSPSVILS